HRPAVDPPVAEADLVEGAGDVLHAVAAGIGEAVVVGVVLPHAVVLDVPDLVAQRPQRGEPIDVEPGLAPERVGAHHPQHDDPLLHVSRAAMRAGLPAMTTPGGTGPSISEPAPMAEPQAHRVAAAEVQQRVAAVQERALAEHDVVGHRHLEPVAVGGDAGDGRGDPGHGWGAGLAGFPATIAPSGTERVTTDPGATW